MSFWGSSFWTRLGTMGAAGAAISAAISACKALKALFGGGTATDVSDKSAGEAAATKAVDVTNETMRAASDAARATQTKLAKELSDASTEVAADAGRLRTANSLRDKQSVVQSAIDRENRRAGGDQDDQARRSV